jgi:hypothetical protein
MYTNYGPVNFEQHSPEGFCPGGSECIEKNNAKEELLAVSWSAIDWEIVIGKANRATIVLGRRGCKSKLFIPIRKVSTSAGRSRRRSPYNPRLNRQPQAAMGRRAVPREHKTPERTIVAEDAYYSDNEQLS